MNKPDKQFIKHMDKQFVLPQTALKMRDAGFPQGKTLYLWHKTKPMKFDFHGMKKGETHWVLYKRNKHDISAFGDRHGYNRWVSAPTVAEAKRWADTLYEMKESLKETEGIIGFLRALLDFLESTEEDSNEL